MKKALSLLLGAALLLFCALPASAAEGFAAFRRSAEYSDGIFPDVPAEAWFRESVAAVYELGLMRGGSDGSFGAADPMRLSETVTLSARMHSLFQTGRADFPPAAEGDPWYQPYVDYAVENGLLAAADRDFGAEATRREFAAILCRALPAEALPAINTIADGAIPDLKADAQDAAEIYRLYRAGILTGNNSHGVFAPETPISRAAAAVITSRMAYRSLRQKFTLEPLVYPDLPEMPRAEDAIFEGSAMLGNSLVDGMYLFSGLNMDFYGITGATVFSTDPDVLSGHAYSKIYLEFGINEISYSLDTIMESYGALVESIRAAQPETEIYVMALTPVTEKRDSKGDFKISAIRDFNTALHEMCRQHQCWYLDCFSALLGEDGFLPESYAGWDGSPHLSAEGYRIWAEYIRTHYI